MPLISDYPSLVKAIQDFPHRQDLAGYVDYFITDAQEAIQNDIFDINFGNATRFQESTYGPLAVAGGVLQPPVNWLSPRTLTISDGAADTWALTFKAPAWIYDNYAQRVPTGLPAFIARDNFPTSVFSGSVSGNTLTVASITSGVLQVGSIIDDTTNNLAFNTIITAFGTGTGGVGTYTVNNAQTVATEVMSGGGYTFIFGPFPDSAYSIQGVYYATTPTLTASAPTNWLTATAPNLLLAACMVQVGRFIPSDEILARWAPVYQQRLKALVDTDKSERWAASTMQISTDAY